MSTIGKALVAGVTGFVGSALARRLIADGAEVIGLVRALSKNRARLAGLSGLNLVEVSAYSFSELTRIMRSTRPKVVFNLAAYGVLAGQMHPDEMVAGNVTVVVNLLRAASGIGLRRFIHTGSCSEYAPTEEPELLGESCSIKPLSIYGAAKAASVHLARTVAARLKIPLVILRPFGIYGPGEIPPRLVPVLIEKLSAGQPVDLTPGMQVRDMTFVGDIVAAYDRAAIAPGLGDDGQVYNVCSGRPTMIRAIGETMADLMGRPRQLLRWGALPPRGDEPAWVVGNPARFEAATGWSAATSLAQGLQATLNWQKTRQEAA